MVYARHCPTRRFTKAEWEAIPRLTTGNSFSGRFVRFLDREGRAVVIDASALAYLRPIIRVRAGRAWRPPERGIYRGLVAGDRMQV